MVRMSFLLLSLGFILFFGSCNVFQKSRPLEISTVVKRLDTIPLKKERSELILNQDSMIIYFSKSYAMTYVEKCMDTLRQNIDNGLYQKTSKRMILRYSFLLEELRTHDTIRIANIPYIDSLSLENMDYTKRMETIERDENLRFGMYFIDIYCSLLESGQLSIEINDHFVDTIYRNRYTISDQFSGASGISFTTSDGDELYRCRPYFRYN